MKSPFLNLEIKEELFTNLPLILNLEDATLDLPKYFLNIGLAFFDLNFFNLNFNNLVILSFHEYLPNRI